MKSTVHIIRSALYFPVGFLPKTGLPSSFVVAVVRQIVRIDAPLRRYLLGVRHEV
jgi:hypothetical protein